MFWLNSSCVTGIRIIVLTICLPGEKIVTLCYPPQLYIVSPIQYINLCQKVRGQFVVLSNIFMDRITCNSGDI